MNEWDLFKAMSELEDEFLCDAPHKKKPLRLLRIGLIAAVVMLLAGTVLAVSVSVSVRHGSQTVWLEEIGLSLPQGKRVETMDYYTADIEFSMQSAGISVPSEAVAVLTDAWRGFTYDYSYFTGAKLTDAAGKRMDLGSVAGAEAYFGIRLMHSAPMDELICGAYATLVVSDIGRAEKEFAETGSVTPDGVELYFPFRRGDGEDALNAAVVREGGLTVYLVITPQFAQQEGVQRVYSYEKEGALHESGLLTAAGKSILLLENAPQKGYDGFGCAAWCENGIGYYAEVHTSSKTNTPPLTLITPLLDELLP